MRKETWSHLDSEIERMLRRESLWVLSNIGGIEENALEVFGSKLLT